MSAHTPGPLVVAFEIFDNLGMPETVIQALNGSSVAVVLDFGTNNPMMREANARRLAACWNACDGLPTDWLKSNRIADCNSTNDLLRERDELRSEVSFFKAQERDTITQVEWLQQANTMHRQVEMLYVVGGYDVTITWDGHAISEPFHGDTLSDAISKAMEEFDLDIRHPYVDRMDKSDVESQSEALLSARPASAAVPDEQTVFEDWLARHRPSGDADSVQSQWWRSSDYKDWRGAAVPEGFAMVPPLKLTRAMQKAMEQDDWEWHDVLVAVEAITEDKCNTHSHPRESIAKATGGAA